MSIPFRFDLGLSLKDIVTGFEGIAMGRTQYFTDCNHYGLCSRDLDKDGKPKEWQWFDETRLQETKKIKVTLNVKKPTSGPHPNAPEM